MRKLLLISLLMMFISGLSAQKYELGFKIGYGSYTMDDLRPDLDRVVTTLPFESCIVSDFPGWIGIGGYFLRKFTRGYALGVEYDFNSTGGRVSSADYSGEYKFDELVACHSFGLVNTFRFLSLGRFYAEARITGGYLYSTIKVTEFLRVADISLGDTASYFSDSFFLEPGVMISCNFSFFRIGVDAGWFLDKGGVIKGDKSVETGSHTNWSGIRIGIRAGIFPEELFRKKKVPPAQGALMKHCVCG